MEARKYQRTHSIVFRKTKEEYGGLSNMAAGYILQIGNVKILTSEAIYQACRYPHLPEVQYRILSERSPMTAKMVSKKYRQESREDWEEVKIKIMRWCLRLKLIQNWDTFYPLLLSTGNKFIVEESRKDDFWGAKPVSQELLIGVNALGRLLMELREEFKESNQQCFVLQPLNIENFILMGKEIEPITVVRREIADTQVSLPSNIESDQLTFDDFKD
ncbi:NADAR family protein [Brevibacillus sp. 179-C9.3 HS]|uniref:NADAR family protein n=1 Tax=unclassified Brevibacillus TaxID=2684853 RepID=UPI00399FF9E3